MGNYDIYDGGEKRPWAAWLAAAAVLAIVVVALLLYFRLAKPRLVPAPASYSTYTPQDGAFKIDQPTGWKATTTGSEALTSGMVFKKGDAKIEVTADLVGSLMADMAQAQANQMENLSSVAEIHLPPQIPPIVKVHQSGLQEMENNYDKYQEMPIQEVTSKVGDGRYSEFTADGGKFVGKLHGYRATFLSQDKRITIVTVCPENNWRILQPAFQHVIVSVDHGAI